LEKGFRISTIIRAASAVAALLLTIFLILIFNKSHRPTLFMLFLSISVCILSSSAFIAVVDPKKVQCANEFKSSTQDNNPLCLIQGAMSVFGLYATAAWLLVLIVHLYMYTIWKSNVMHKRYVLLHVFCWGLPLVLTTIAISMGAIRYEYGENCTIGHKHATYLLIIPLLLMIIPGFIALSCTVFYTIKNMNTIRMDPSKRVPWNSFVVAFALMCAMIVSSVLFLVMVTQWKHMAASPAKFTPWYRCIGSGGDQTTCASIIESVVPNPATMFAADSSISIIGFILALLVIFRPQFICDLKAAMAKSDNNQDTMEYGRSDDDEVKRRASLSETLGSTSSIYNKNGNKTPTSY